MFNWVLNTPLINYHLVLTLKSVLSFKLLYFDFSRKETLTQLTILVKTIPCKTEHDIEKYNHWYSPVSTSSSFQFSWMAILNIFRSYSSKKDSFNYKEIPLWVRPIGIGGILRRVIRKIVMKLLRRDVLKATGSLQLCSG